MSNPLNDFAHMIKAACLLMLVSGLRGWGSLSAQSIYGTITGVVTDPSGAAMVGADVEALNQGTGLKRKAESDSTGTYIFDNVEPGLYTITVTSEQFVTVKNENVTLLAREIARSDVQMQVKGSSEKVEVQSDQAVVSQDTTETASLSGREINSLALNFRATANPSPIVVANLAPNVQSDTSGNLTISGQLPTATSFSLD